MLIHSGTKQVAFYEFVTESFTQPIWLNVPVHLRSKQMTGRNTEA